MHLSVKQAKIHYVSLLAVCSVSSTGVLGSTLTHPSHTSRSIVSFTLMIKDT